MITLKISIQKIISPSTPNLLDPRRQIKFTFPLKKRKGLNYGFTWEAPPPSLHLANCPEVCTDKWECHFSVVEDTNSYGLDELGITPEFTVYIRVS